MGNVKFILNNQEIIHKIKRYKNIQIITVLIICAMISRQVARYNLVTGAFNMAVSILRSGIYIGLIIAWGISIKKRVLHSSVQKYLLAIDGLLLSWMILRTCKYLFLEGIDVAREVCWYAFYIPMLVIPLMAIFVAQCLGESQYYKIPKIFQFLYLPNIFLILMVMTNHYHFFVFDFIGGIASPDLQYRYGMGYFMVLFWMAVEIIFFIFLLLKKSHVPGKHKRIIAPMIPLCVGIIYAAGYILRVPILYEIAGDMTVAYLLVIMSVCELCIRSGLIPANEFYEELFQSSMIGAQIIDNDNNVHYISDSARCFDKETIEMAKEQSVDLGYERLLAAKIHGGYVLWLDDISKIKGLLQDLENTSKELSKKNEILKTEVSLKEKKAQTKEQARLYNKIAMEVRPQLEHLEELLDLAKTSEKTTQILARICVISSYIKRIGNLILLGEDANYLPVKELEYCIRESMENIQLSNIMVSFDSKCDGLLRKDDMLKIYRTFETLIEVTMPSLRALLVNLNSENENIHLKIGISCNISQWNVCKEMLLQEDFIDQISEENEDYMITFLCRREKVAL